MRANPVLRKIKMGISSCLLGEKVRYDGGHKLDRFLTETLGQYLEFVPVCPEVECGLGIPREAMRLVASPQGPRLVTIRPQVDYSQPLLAWARKRLAELEREDLCGFIFKSGSPSCGIEKIRVYGGQGGPAKAGAGLFAREFMRHFPLLPGADEVLLHDPAWRENFLARLFTMKRWRETVALGAQRGHLMDFHTRHQLLIMSHSPRHCRLLGKLVAQLKAIPLAQVYEQYQTLLMAALLLKSTINKNVNVLFQVMSYFKKELSPFEKEELLEIINNYRQGDIPLIIAVTLLNHLVRKYDQAYLKNQYYLNPHPLELKLRSGFGVVAKGV